MIPVDFYWVDCKVTSTAADHLYIYADELNTSTTITVTTDFVEEPYRPPKAVVRSRRPESLAACRERRLEHERLPRSLNLLPWTVRAPRPTIRKTATATKNFRRQ